MVAEIPEKKFMLEALKLAKISASLGEVPVGAVVVSKGQIVGTGLNRRELMGSCLEHAELNALKEASQALGRWRLTETVVYTTLEPCIMCAGALLHARISGLFYGAADPKFGAMVSLYRLAEDIRLNHRFKVVGGFMAEESAKLLKEFFRELRAEKA